MDGKAVFKTQIEWSRQIVNGTMANVDADVSHYTPGGKAHPIGATYAHIVLAEDFIVNMLIRGKTPLVMGEWAAKTGLSDMPPPPGQGDMFAWANKVQVDLGKLQDYAKAVYAATDEYVDSLTPEELDRQMSIPGFPDGPVASFLTIAAVVHPSNHIGEISAMKGIQGLQGYPF